MKCRGVVIAVLGFLVLAVSSWLANQAALREIKRELHANISPQLGTTSVDAQSLRTKAIASRLEATKSLSELRRKKIKIGYGAYEQKKFTVTTELSAETRRIISEIIKELEEIDKEAEKVERQAMEALYAYESALNKTVEEAFDLAGRPSTFGLNGILAVLGAVVSLIGLVVRVRDSEVERQKKQLEIEELRAKLARTVGEHKGAAADNL